MQNDSKVRYGDCSGLIVSEEVLKAKEQLDTLRVSEAQMDTLRECLDIEEIKQRIEELKLGRRISRAERDEKMDEVLSQFALETLPELKVVIQALALVLTAHIKDMAPEPKKPTEPTEPKKPTVRRG